jgi:hypothetical protein
VDDIADVQAAERRVRALGAELLYDGIVPHGEGASSGGIFFADPDGIRWRSTRARAPRSTRRAVARRPSCGFLLGPRCRRAGTRASARPGAVGEAGRADRSLAGIRPRSRPSPRSSSPPSGSSPRRAATRGAGLVLPARRTAGLRPGRRRPHGRRGGAPAPRPAATRSRGARRRSASWPRAARPAADAHHGTAVRATAAGARRRVSNCPKYIQGRR